MPIKKGLEGKDKQEVTGSTRKRRRGRLGLSNERAPARAMARATAREKNMSVAGCCKDQHEERRNGERRAE